MEQDHRIWLLISLKLSGEATVEELEELGAFLSETPELVKKVEILQELWKSPEEIDFNDTEHSFEKHLERLNHNADNLPFLNTDPLTKEETDLTKTKAGKSYYKLWWGVMAAASVLVFWLYFTKGNDTGSEAVNNTVSTKAGFKASINLPDGSKVWLNGNSKITYNGDFRGKTREVFLSGEAYFDVAKDKTRPFIIHTNTINLKVLGTAFNVRSYDNDKETETSLVHGSIEITLRNNPDKKIVLKPGEKLLVKNALTDTLVKEPQIPESDDAEKPIAVLANMHYYGNDSSSVETSWTKNELIFNNERLDKIVLNLERWFNISMIIKSESLKKERFTITIEEGDELKDVLEGFKAAERLHYTLKNNEVIINR